jgi:hypothetical protein
MRIDLRRELREGDPVDVGPRQERSLLRAPRRCLLVTSLALLVLAGAANLALGAAASSRVGGVPSAASCQTLLGRAPAPSTPPVQAPSEKPLVDEVSEFVELSVRDDQRYVFPTADERARFQCGFQYAAAGRLVPAARLLEPLQYEVRQLIDTGARAGELLVLLQERRSKDRDGIERYRHAWGLYVIATRSALPVLAVEVPHPCKSSARCNAVGGDRRTHTMAVTSFERAGAKYLFIAGTDRGATATGCPQRPCSADVAHESASMFEAAHEAALAPSLYVRAADRVYQPHGFSTTNHPPSCQQVVVSAGIEQDASPGIETTRLARRIAAALRTDASDVYRNKVLLFGQDVAPPGRPDGRVDCSTEDDPSGGLGATTNVQSQFAASLTPPRDFVSVESSERVRNSAAEREALSNTIGTAISAP